MSTVIMHTASVYEFGDCLLKNQITSRTQVHVQQSAQSNGIVTNGNVNSGNTASTTSQLTSSLSPALNSIINSTTMGAINGYTNGNLNNNLLNKTNDANGNNITNTIGDSIGKALENYATGGLSKNSQNNNVINNNNENLINTACSYSVTNSGVNICKANNTAITTNKVNNGNNDNAQNFISDAINNIPLVGANKTATKPFNKLTTASQHHLRTQQHALNSENNMTPGTTSTITSVGIQEHVNVVSGQQKQQNNRQAFAHSVLSRTVSSPQTPSNAPNIVTLMSSLFENLGHRKLERTQSEPLPQVNTSRYKTELCRPFEEAGECKYGEKCQFAHGIQELRNLQRHPKYKTEFCRTYHSIGFCPYGPRCHFVHNVDEARNSQNLPMSVTYNVNRLTSANGVNVTQSQQNILTTVANGGQHSQPQHAIHVNNHHANQLHQQQQSIALSPPLSMSTGSDHASPNGSLSLSPTSSIACFPFADQISPVSSVFAQPFNFNSPPDSPRGDMSPATTPSPPPPSVVIAPTIAKKKLQQKHILSPFQQTSILNGNTNINIKI